MACSRCAAEAEPQKKKLQSAAPHRAQDVDTQTTSGSGLFSFSTISATAPRPASTSFRSLTDGSEQGDFFTESLTAANAQPGMFQSQDLGPVAPAASNHCTPTITSASLPSGALTATASGGKFGVPFVMEADFNSAIPCRTGLGEYRQYVRGFASIDGVDVVHPLCSNTMSRTTWYEDCLTSGGTDLKYGYHSLPFSTSRFTNPDQATGDSYRGRDHPGFPLAGRTSGEVLVIALEFKGDLVDTTSSNAVLRSSTWTVAGTYTVP